MNMFNKLIGFTVFFITLLSLTDTSLACTHIRMTAQDGTMMIGRSMEFAIDMAANVRTSTRERQFVTTSPNGKPGLAWKAKYGYVYLDGMNQDVAVDGMNEVGLSISALYLPGETKYQVVAQGQEDKALPYIQLGDWVLGNFKTIDEVKSALNTIIVFAQTIPGLGNTIFPLHFAITDATGKGIVVEFVDGKMNVYDNPIGILTNSPVFPWQLDNLRNYLNLSPFNPNPVSVDGLTFAVTGQGAGNVGLPGDVSPPSRFVKMAFLVNNAFPVSNANSALNLTEHIMNNVDIPIGIARAMVNNKISTDYTQWVVFKDLTHQMFYYRTYNDMTLHAINLTKLNFEKPAPRLKMPITGAPTLLDETARFLNTKNG